MHIIWPIVRIWSSLLALFCLGLFGPMSLAPSHAAVDELHTEGADVAHSDDLDTSEPAEAAEFKAVRLPGPPLEFPWSVAFLPDGRILVTERPGRLRVIEGGELHPQSIEGLPEVVSGEHAGLLDVLVAPDFADSRILYLSYTHGSRNAASLRIMRARLDDMTLADQTVIFESRPAIAGLEQLGGRLAFGPDGLLYLTVGDRFQRERAQDLQDHAGTIIRLHPDGRVPDDNPFVGRTDVLPEIYTYGHRNPQGLTTETRFNRLWSVEHGPNGGDELNIIEAGRNYGWPLTTYGIDYDGKVIAESPTAPGVVSPTHYWVPSVAPSSMAFYAGDPVLPAWQNNLLIGTLAGQMLIRLELADDVPVKEERLLVKELGRLRDVRAGPDGFVYLLTDGAEAEVYRLEPITEEVAGRPLRTPLKLKQ